MTLAYCLKYATTGFSILSPLLLQVLGSCALLLAIGILLKCLGFGLVCFFSPLFGVVGLFQPEDQATHFEVSGFY